MTSFTTFNQFDKRFSEFGKFGNDRTCCPLFGVLTCYNFMQNQNLSQKQHEQNIYSSITNYMINNIPKYLSFDELLEFSTQELNGNLVNATTPELITTGVLSYEHMFKPTNGLVTDQTYCILFLKNRNYLPVLCQYIAPKAPDEAGQEIYAIRDCHEGTQRTFYDFPKLRQYLDKTYQFEQMTIVDGVMIPEFSNIELLVIDQPFELKNIDPELYDHTIDEDKTYKEEVIITTVVPKSEKVVQFQNSDFDYDLALSLGDGQGDDYVNFI